LIVASTRATHTYATQVRIPSMKKKNLATSWLNEKKSAEDLLHETLMEKYDTYLTSQLDWLRFCKKQVATS
jgi:hypothetical protein